jgi:3-polyprenyl-4-hydroxybenzoate decarboxylase
MATNIAVKLDVTKIDKLKLYKGEKGTYLDAVIIMKDESDQYGNIGMIVQSVTKEEREQGIRGAILGNVRYIQKPVQEQPKVDFDDLPF